MYRIQIPHRQELATAVILVLTMTLPALSQAPLDDPSEVAWSHAPFEIGECGLCHRSDDPEAPGEIISDVNELCFGCHIETQDALAAATVTHLPVQDSCTNCHNAHNSRFPKLLLNQAPGLCAECHADVWAEATWAPVRHAAVTTGGACSNCHDPHAANVESLLKGLAYDLCVTCHAEAGLRDDQDRELTNFGELLASNPIAHGPVAAKDCTACHRPHGGETFRLLVAEYPAKFYAAFDPENYRLCFECHNEEVVAVERTTTLTGFRDGSRNLHFVHVNKQDRGRTCRACHEVHAAPQEHLIRHDVPYGKSGWTLTINYQRTAEGGSCQKTCHGAKTYDRNTGIGEAASQ